MQARADAASEHGRPACLITMEFCHFTVRHTGWAIDCFYMTRRGELYQRGRTGEGVEWGEGAVESERTNESLSSSGDGTVTACCSCTVAVDLWCGWLCGTWKEKVVTGKTRNVYCNNDSRTST